VIRYLYRIPFRQLEGLVRSLRRLCGWDIEVPDYSTICRRQRGLRGKLSEFEREFRGKGKGARYIVVDSTGVKVFNEGEWRKLRERGRIKVRDFVKLHVCVNEGGELLVDYVSESSDGDSEVFIGELWGRVKEELGSKWLEVEGVIGDSGYDSRGVWEEVGRGKECLVRPRRNAVYGLHDQRDEILRGIEEWGDEWGVRSGYSRRWVVEGYFSRLKRWYGEYVMSVRRESMGGRDESERGNIKQVV